MRTPRKEIDDNENGSRVSTSQEKNDQAATQARTPCKDTDANNDGVSANQEDGEQASPVSEVWIPRKDVDANNEKEEKEALGRVLAPSHASTGPSEERERGGTSSRGIEGS